MNTNNQTTSTIGPIIGSLIVVVVLIIAALYVWSQHLATEEKRQAEIDRANATNGQVIIIPIHSTSTNPVDIQKDLNATPPIHY
ncbi:MAG: hypothetical protein WCQ60_00335 [bacterium]